MADPIAGIPYPVLTDAADLPASMKPTIDSIGAKIGAIRNYTVDVSQASRSAGATVATLALPAQPFACRVLLDFIGHGGFQATATDFGLTGSTTAGTLTPFTGLITPAAAAKWYPYVWRGRLDLAASTAATLTWVNSSSASTWFWGMVTARILYSGEYA